MGEPRPKGRGERKGKVAKLLPFLGKEKEGKRRQPSGPAFLLWGGVLLILGGRGKPLIVLESTEGRRGECSLTSAGRRGGEEGSNCSG